MRFLRFLKIFFTIVRFGLDELVLSGINDRRVRLLRRITTFGRKVAQAEAAKRLGIFTLRNRLSARL